MLRCKRLVEGVLDYCCLMQLAHNIHALASKGDLTFAAVGTRIVVCKRAHRYVFKGSSFCVPQPVLPGLQIG